MLHDSSFRALVYALAVYRLTNLICHERGPLDMFVRLRYAVGFRYDDDETVPLGFLAGLLGCPLCLSVWLAAGATGCYILRWPALDALALWLALAAVSLFAFDRGGA